MLPINVLGLGILLNEKRPNNIIIAQCTLMIFIINRENVPNAETSSMRGMDMSGDDKLNNSTKESVGHNTTGRQ